MFSLVGLVLSLVFWVWLVWLGLVGLVWQVWFGGFGLAGLVWWASFGRIGLVDLVWYVSFEQKWVKIFTLACRAEGSDPLPLRF